MDYTSLGCCTLAFVLYLNTLNSGFVYDDRRAIMTNADVSGGSPWQSVFLNDYWGTPLTDSGSHGSYRPLCVLSFRFNFLIGGYSPWGFHLINNLMHCFATGLVVKLARHFLSSVWGVVATGALFAAHPIHTEAVAGIVGRADLAACIFYLLTYLVYMRHIIWRERGDGRQWAALMVTIVLAFIALLFKETAITVLLVCGFFDVIRGLCGFKDKRRIRSLSILTAALVCTIYCRLIILQRPQATFSTADNPVARSKSFWTRLLTFIYLPVYNFKLLLNPQMLSFDWGMEAIPRITCLWDRRNMLSLCFYSVLVSASWRSCKILLNKHYENSATRSSVASAGGTQHRFQQSHTHRKSRTKKKFAMSLSAPANLDAEYTSLNDIASVITTSHLPYPISSALPFNTKQKLLFSTMQLSCICNDCSDQQVLTCRGLNNNNNNNNTNYNNNNSNNNNNNNTLFINGNSLYNDCCCQQIMSSNDSSQILTMSMHKTIAPVTMRSSRSSSSCSNSTTVSNKSSGSTTSSCSSLFSLSSSSTEISNLGSEPRSRGYEPMLPFTSPCNTNACVLLMAIAFLVLPFLPATNLFFYVGFVVAERLLYLPSVGYCLLVGMGIAKLAEPVRTSNSRRCKIIISLCMSIALCALSVRTVRRNLDWRDEESLYRSAIHLNPPKALANLGSVLSSQARYEEAKEVLHEALKYRPNMADVHFNLGILYQKQRNFKAAVGNFQRAIQFRPNLAVAYLNLGTSLIAMGKSQEAAYILQEGTRIDGNGVRDRMAHENAQFSSYLQLGALYIDQGKYQRALAVYREALHALPANYNHKGVLFHRIGDVLSILQQWDEAEKYHKAALELHPEQVDSYLSYGITLARNSSRALEAELWFKRALQLAPEQASVHHQYAEFLTSQMRIKEAVPYRLRAAEISPNDYSMVVAAATALRIIDRKIEAEIWYRKAVALRPMDAYAHTNLGAILHLLGRTNIAAASYREALRLQPGDPTTLSNLAKLGVAEKK